MSDYHEHNFNVTALNIRTIAWDMRYDLPEQAVVTIAEVLYNYFEHMNSEYEAFDSTWLLLERCMAVVYHELAEGSDDDVVQNAINELAHELNYHKEG